MNKLVLRVFMSTVVSATTSYGVVAASGDEFLAEGGSAVVRAVPSINQNRPYLTSSDNFISLPNHQQKQPEPSSGAVLYILKAVESGDGVYLVRKVYGETSRHFLSAAKKEQVESVQPILQEQIGVPNRFDSAMANVRAWIQDTRESIGQVMEDIPAKAKAQFVSGFQSLRSAVSNFFSM